MATPSARPSIALSKRADEADYAVPWKRGRLGPSQALQAQNFAMKSPPNVNCELLVPAANGVAPFKVQS